MEIKVNLSAMPAVKVEGVLSVSGLFEPIMAKEIAEAFEKIKKDNDLTGSIEYENQVAGGCMRLGDF